MDEIQVARRGASTVVIHHNRQSVVSNSSSDIYTLLLGPDGLVTTRKKIFPVLHEGERSACLEKIVGNPEQADESCSLCQEFVDITLPVCESVQKSYRFFVPSWPDTFRFVLDSGQTLIVRFVHAPQLESSAWSSDDLFEMQRRNIPTAPLHYPYEGIERRVFRPDVSLLRDGVSHDPEWSSRFFGLEKNAEAVAKEEDTVKDEIVLGDRIRFMNPYADN